MMFTQAEEQAGYLFEMAAARVLRAVEAGYKERDLEQAFGAGAWAYGQDLAARAVMIYSPAFRRNDYAFSIASRRSLEDLGPDSQPVLIELDAVDFRDGGEKGPGHQWAAVIRVGKRLLPHWATALYIPQAGGLELRPLAWSGSGRFNHWAYFKADNGPVTEREALCGQAIPGQAREEVEQSLPGAPNCLACLHAFNKGRHNLSLSETSIVYEAGREVPAPALSNN